MLMIVIQALERLLNSFETQFSHWLTENNYSCKSRGIVIA